MDNNNIKTSENLIENTSCEKDCPKKQENTPCCKTTGNKDSNPTLKCGQRNCSIFVDILKGILTPISLLVTTALLIGISLSIYAGLAKPNPAQYVSTIFPISIAITLIMEALLVFIGYKYLLKNKQTGTFNKPNLKHVLWALIIGATFHSVLQIIAITISKTTGTEFGANQTTQQLGLLYAPIVFILAGIIVPIVEELVFRGFLYDWIENDKVKIIVPSIMFGLLHYENASALGILTLIVTTSLGFVSALCRKKTGNIYGSIAIHVVYNMATLVLLFFV